MHCTGKHNTITVPAGVDGTGNSADTSGRNAAPAGNSNNYPVLPPGGRPPTRQRLQMRPVAVPNGGRAPISYATCAARGAESSAQQDPLRKGTGG